MLIEFKSRTAGASRVFINPDHVVAVYVRADGCHIALTERAEGGRSVHVLVDEPVNRVLAKLGIETTSVPIGPPVGPATLTPRPRETDDTLTRLVRDGETRPAAPAPSAAPPLPGLRAGLLRTSTRTDG